MTESTPKASISPQKKMRLGIRSKFLFVLLGSTIACVLITAFQGLVQTQTALNNSIYQHLVSLRENRKEQIEHYFKEKNAEMLVFSQNPAVVTAMREFNAAAKLLTVYDAKINEQQAENLRTHYKKELVAKLQSQTGEIEVVDTYLPKDSLSQYLQYQYIVDNPAPVGSKHLHLKSLDGSYYSELHEKHHPMLKQISDSFGFYDLFLIDNEESRIIYSVHKELDYGTSLYSGPYFESNLATGLRRSLQNPTRGEVTISDYKPYIPSLNAAAAFFVVPIYDGVDLIGTLAAQVSTDQINEIMTDHYNWERAGLEKTGETFLVAKDRLMRSDSRFVLEKRLQKNNKDDGAKDDSTVKNDTSILIQRVDNEGVAEAFNGKSGIKEMIGYRGEAVMSAYAPLNIDGLDWAVVSEKSDVEAHHPITTIEKALLTGAAITTALMTLYGLLVSNLFLSPIQKLLRNVNLIRAGEETVSLTSNRRDEFGQLINSVNEITTSLQEKENTIVSQNVKLKERLLLIYPPPIVDKIESGQELVGDLYQNVAIVVVTLQGFNEAVSDVSAEESVVLLNQIINAFDEAADLNNVEKIASQGNLYIASSGLLHPRLDYARSAVSFAESLFVIIDRFNISHGDSVSIRIGVSSGDVTAGVIGKIKPAYNLMGDSVTVANVLAQNAVRNSVRVSAPVYNQMLETEHYESKEIMKLPHIGQVTNWERLFTPGSSNQEA